MIGPLRKTVRNSQHGPASKWSSSALVLENGCSRGHFDGRELLSRSQEILSYSIFRTIFGEVSDAGHSCSGGHGWRNILITLILDSKRDFMTKFLVCLVTALWCFSASAQSGEMNNNTVESEIAALEQSWAAAQKANDPTAIAPLLADNFIEVIPDGSLMNKSQVLDDAKKSKYQTIELSDLKITLFGDTAIVVGTFDAKHSDKHGKPLQDHERFVDTWRKMPGGKWQCIAEGNTVLR